jgi:hypothetical protein
MSFRKALISAALCTGTLISLPALADHHGHGGYGHYGPSPRFYGPGWSAGHWYHGWYGGRAGWWWTVGGAWYLYPTAIYPYPDPYAVPLVSLPAPPAAQGPGAPQYWYWCGNPAGYYPNVGTCNVQWQAVAPGAAVNGPDDAQQPLSAPPPPNPQPSYRAYPQPDAQQPSYGQPNAQQPYQQPQYSQPPGAQPSYQPYPQSEPPPGGYAPASPQTP